MSFTFQVPEVAASPLGEQILAEAQKEGTINLNSLREYLTLAASQRNADTDAFLYSVADAIRPARAPKPMSPARQAALDKARAVAAANREARKAAEEAAAAKNGKK